MIINDNKWGCSPTSNGCLAVICETRSQTKHNTIATHFVLHQLNWVKLDYRKVKFLAVDFTEEVTLQPLTNDLSNRIPKANVYVVC